MMYQMIVAACLAVFIWTLPSDVSGAPPPLTQPNGTTVVRHIDPEGITPVSARFSFRGGSYRAPAFGRFGGHGLHKFGGRGFYPYHRGSGPYKFDRKPFFGGYGAYHRDPFFYDRYSRFDPAWRFYYSPYGTRRPGW